MRQVVGRFQLLVIAAGGVAATLGLYWDDAWHTDRGRDTFFSPPHLLLYAGVALLLGFAAWWVWSRHRTEGGAVWRDPVLVLPLLGALVTLGAAPVDELWHELFGRDAVVWSPPHMVAVAGMLAFAAGLFAAVRSSDTDAPVVSAVVGAFVVAAAVTPVMEFEADVPQFAVVWYWPVVIGMLLLAFALVRQASDRRWAVTEAAAVYVALRVLVVGFLAVMDHSLPTVMPTVAAAAVFDVAMRRGAGRALVSLATAATIAGSYTAAHAWQPAGLTFTGSDVLVGSVGGALVGCAVLAAVGVGSPGRPQGRAGRAVAAALVVLATTGWSQPASAHDPGQGEEVAPVLLVAERTGGAVTLEVTAEGQRCDRWTPDRTVARRAGQARFGTLDHVGGCRFVGSVQVDDPGRWFLYAELTADGQLSETWIPVERGRTTKQTVLYAAPTPAMSAFKVVLGVALYLVVVGIIGAVAWTYRRTVPALVNGP